MLIQRRKTQIALAYVYWLQEEYSDVSVFWVHASNAARFRQSYDSIAQECQVPGYGDAKTDVLPLVKMWLERKDRGRWLMVIDNADDTQLVSGPEGLGQHIPECAHGSVLVTTRNKEAGSRLTRGGRLIEVKKMDESESKELLEKKLEGDGAGPDDLSTLSSRLEHLPLALVQAAAFMQEKSMPISRYLQLLDKSDQNLVDLLSEEFETVGRDSTARAVTETWILSFDQIKQQNALAGDLLALMSLFDRQAIPSDFLSDYSKQQSGQGPRGDLELDKALGVLKAFSFVVEGGNHGLDMHRLVQLVTQKWLVKKDTMRHFAGQALLAVSHIYPLGNYENRSICTAYLPHVDAVLKLEGTGARDENLARASLLHRVAGLYDYQGQWKDAEKLQAQAVELRGGLLGEEHPLTLTSMANLASIYWKQGRWKEAESLFVQVIETSKRVLGEEHADTLTSIANLASTYWNQGRWKEAESLFVQVIEIKKRVLGEEHADMLTSIANLASTYWNQGRWKEAESLFVQVIEIRKRVLGEEHPDTLASMNNLALTYQKQGRWKEAESLFVQVIEIRKRVLGEEHPDTLASINNLALTYQNQGRWEEAESLEVQVMETKKRVLGEEHPHMLTSMNNLASTYQNQGRWEEAESLEVQVMETKKRVLGEEHPNTLTSINNLASMYWNQGRWEEAELLEVQVMETRKRVLGEEHPDTLTSMANLASTYWNQGQWKEAELLEVQVMETRKRVLGEEHPDTLTSMNNLAFTWHSQGCLRDALNLMQRCFYLQQQALRPNHPYTKSTLSTLKKWQHASNSLPNNTSVLEGAGMSRQQCDNL